MLAPRSPDPRRAGPEVVEAETTGLETPETTDNTDRSAPNVLHGYG